MLLLFTINTHRLIPNTIAKINRKLCYVFQEKGIDYSEREEFYAE